MWLVIKVSIYLGWTVHLFGEGMLVRGELDLA